LRGFFAQAAVAFHASAEASIGLFQYGLIIFALDALAGETVVGREGRDIEFDGASF
jgi:hypothetical protein